MLDLGINFMALERLDIEAHERALIAATLRRSTSVREAATLLKVSRFALRRRLEKLGMPTDPFARFPATAQIESPRPTPAPPTPTPTTTAPALPPGIRLPPKRKHPRAKAAALSAAVALAGCDQGRPVEQPAGGVHLITGAEDDASGGSSGGSTSGDSTSSSSSGGEASGSSADIPPADLATTGGGESTGEDGTGDASTSGGSSGEVSTSSSTSSSTGEDSSSGSSSTGQGPAPTGCPCAPGIDNFCDLAPGTCPPTAPGGYCDPNGNGDYLDGDFTAGFLDWTAECG